MGRQQLLAGSVVLLVAAAAAAALLTRAGGHGASRAPTLSAGLFTTSYEPGWSLTSEAGLRGSHRYQLSSTGAAVDRLGIPATGAVGITIDESAPSILASARLPSAASGGAPSLSALELLPIVVGVPRGAVGVQRTGAPRRITLDGAEAGEESYAYTYRGRTNVQADVLAQREGRIVLVELDAEPTLARGSQEGLEAVTLGWRWR